jgi:hypothetical protein
MSPQRPELVNLIEAEARRRSGANAQARNPSTTGGDAAPAAILSP